MVTVMSVSVNGVFRFILRIGYLRGIITFGLSVKVNLDNVSLYPADYSEKLIKKFFPKLIFGWFTFMVSD